MVICKGSSASLFSNLWGVEFHGLDSYKAGSFQIEHVTQKSRQDNKSEMPEETVDLLCYIQVFF